MEKQVGDEGSRGVVREMTRVVRRSREERERGPESRVGTPVAVNKDLGVPFLQEDRKRVGKELRSRRRRAGEQGETSEGT